MDDTPTTRAKRAADILYRYVTRDDDAMGIRRAVNDALNVLVWGKTCA